METKTIEAVPFKTNCEIKIPKKYHPMIKEVDYEGKESGYWLYLNDGYVTENGYGCQTIHETSKAGVLKALQKVVEVKKEKDSNVAEIEKILAELGEEICATPLETERILKAVREKEKIELIASAVVKFTYWGSFGMIEMRVRNDMLSTYENNGKLKLFYNQKKRLDELLRKVV